MSAHSLFAPDQLPIKVTIDQQVACVDRELRYRRHVYPRRVLAGQMSQARADEQIAFMEAVRTTLLSVRTGRSP